MTLDRLMPMGLTIQGRVAKEIQTLDWSDTELGAEDSWPGALINALNVCLSAPYPSLVFWGRGHRVFYNDAFDSHMGELNAGHVLGQMAETAIPKLWEWMSARVREVFQSGEPFEGEDLLLGDEFPAIWAVTPLLGEGGRVGGVLCTWTVDVGKMLDLREQWMACEADLRDRLLRSQALLLSEERFRAVTENSVDTIAITDARGRFKYVSSSAREVLGYEEEELLGRPLFDFVPASEVHHLRNEFTQLVHQPGSVATLSFSFEHKNTGACYLAIRAKSLLEDVAIEGVLLNIRDVTESKGIETQLRKAKEHAEEIMRLKSSLLANMSHEIRTPLTSILGIASLVAEKVPEEFRDSLHMIERGGARLAETLNSVLLLAQFESHAVAMELESVDLVEETEEVVSALRPLANERNLYLSTLAGESKVYGCVDRTFFARILNNLIGNALKFTKEGGVTVELQPEDSWIKISVCDTGIGIKPEFLPKIFDEFSQENSSLSGASQGSGLGLAITRRLVEALGGTIEVRSRPGEGSVFTVRVKRCDEQDVPEQESENRELAAKNEALLRQRTAAIDPSLQVLVVEDNEAIRTLVHQQLDAICQVTVCMDAESALRQARAQVFDIVLMDIGLPGMSGLDAVGLLRQIPEYETRAIVALTGHAMPGDRERILSAGFSHYLEKPFSFRDLIEAILTATAGTDETTN